MTLIYSVGLCITALLLQVCRAQNGCEHPDQLSGVISYSSEYRKMEYFTKCWYINTPEDSLIRLSFKELQLNDPYCDSAYIEVYDDMKQKEKICQYDYKSSTNWTKTFLGSVNITLKLRSTWDYVYFRLQYNIESIICSRKNHFRCSPNQCIRSNQVCDGVEDCENGLDESECGIVAIKGANVSRISAIRWLKNRQSNFGWGRNTHRAITALYLTGAAQFRGKKIDEEIIVKQLELKTATSLLRNSTDRLSVNELSMYVNALTVTCHNYRKFNGLDLLKILASRTFSTSSPSPGAYVTLCNANWPFSRHNVNQLLNLLTKNTEYPFVLEFQAMTIMALSCIKEKTDVFHSTYNASDLYNVTVENFMAIQQRDGSFGNVHTTAMVTQALIASGETENRRWSVDNAVQFLIRSLNSSSVDFLSVYFTLPLFKGKTLVDIGKVDCSGYQRELEEDDDILDVMDKLGGKIHVQYSLYIGDHRDVMHTVYLRVPENSTAYDVMKVAQVADPKYTFSYHEARDHVYIYAIAGITNDMEAGKYWLLYTANTQSNETLYLTHYTESPDEITVENKDHLVMWYKSVSI